MASKGINKVILVGNLGKDPEVRYTPNGKAAANLTIATSESWKDQQGQLQERTEWHRVSMFGKLAEIAGEYLKKGSQVYIEGKLQTRKWQDQNGQDRYTTEIVLDPFNGVMQMLGGRQGGGMSQGQSQGGGFQPQNQAPAQQQQPQYQQYPGQNNQQAAPQQNAGGYTPNQNQGGFNPNAGSAPAQNQAPASKPMSEPDFDFDDDIPF